MKNPYLIQRITLRDVKKGEITGVDSLFSYDYMGSAEFEFGALGHSLTRICQTLGEYEIIPTDVKLPTGQGIFLIGKKSLKNEVLAAFQFAQHTDDRETWGKNCGRPTKEYVGIGAMLKGEKPVFCSGGIDVWWDIENDWFACVSKDTAKLALLALEKSKAKKVAQGKI